MPTELNVIYKPSERASALNDLLQAVEEKGNWEQVARYAIEELAFSSCDCQGVLNLMAFTRFVKANS